MYIKPIYCCTNRVVQHETKSCNWHELFSSFGGMKGLLSNNVEVVSRFNRGRRYLDVSLLILSASSEILRKTTNKPGNQFFIIVLILVYKNGETRKIIYLLTNLAWSCKHISYTNTPILFFEFVCYKACKYTKENFTPKCSYGIICRSMHALV